MKVVRNEVLFACGPIEESGDWDSALSTVQAVVKAMEWPEGSGKFSINPRKEGNGVRAIKEQFAKRLKTAGWATEEAITFKSELKPGNLDFMLKTKNGPIAIEWETGNISSSHRSMNKLALALIEGVVAGAIMLVPSRDLYKFLTDRIGNIKELEPYLAFWRAINCVSGAFAVVVFEHDNTDKDSPLVPKGLDGNAKKTAKEVAEEILKTDLDPIPGSEKTAT